MHNLGLPLPAQKRLLLHRRKSVLKSVLKTVLKTVLQTVFARERTKTIRNGLSVRQHCLFVRSVAEEVLRPFPHVCEDTGLERPAIIFLAAAYEISLDFLQKIPIWLRQEAFEAQARNALWQLRCTVPA